VNRQSEEDEEDGKAGGEEDVSPLGKGKYKKWMTQQANYKKKMQDSCIITRKSNLVKVKT